MIPSALRRKSQGHQEVKNILNDQDIRTGGYEQMRLRRVRTPEGVKFSRFDSKYFYMLGTNYYLNVYFRF